MVKILLLGFTGQVGWEARRALAGLGEVAAYDYPDVDFTHPESLREFVIKVKPQIIYNAAAYTAVDRAETETETNRMINAIAPGVLAETAQKLRAALVHFSTDYVYDGAKGAAYVETDAPHPLNAYGQAKLDGDRAIEEVGGSWFIFRTTWVYSTRRDSFVSKVLEWSRKNPTLRIVDDQVAGPTWARGLAEITALLLAKAGNDPFGWAADRKGLYHLSGSGWCSRYDWAQEILRLDPAPEQRIATAVLPAKTADFPTPALRPLYSPLDCTKFNTTFGLKLPDWKHALALAMG
jgi:dTDP-4-dehydrorhamnose reductase